MSTLTATSATATKQVLTFFLAAMLIAVCVCTVNSACALAPYTGVVRITADGTVEGTDKISRNGNVYTLTGDLSGSVEDGNYLISIEKDNIVFDGAGKTIQGTNSGTAIIVRGKTDITIMDTRIINFGTGIELRGFDWDLNTTASNNRVIDNYFETKYWGVDFGVNNGFVSGNTFVSKNSLYGVIMQANQTSFTDNAFLNGGLVLYDPGVGNVFSGNTINGKPLIVLEGQSSQVVDDANQVILFNCKDMVIQNVNDLGLRMPVMLFGTSNTKISNCKTSITLIDSNSNTLIDNDLSETGSPVNYNDASIELQNSHNNTLTQNIVKASGCNGILLSGSAYNKIEKNVITSTGADKAGIRLELAGCEYNYIYENSITSEVYGVYLRGGAENNVVFKNVVNQCKNGFFMICSRNNDFLANHISGSSEYAVNMGGSDFNRFFWNNFEGNTKVNENHQMYWWFFQNDTYYAEYNMYDNGREGNYWSDYTGSDTNGDGIGETPYHIYENFTDNYPLTTPYDTSTVQVDFKQWNPQTPTNTSPPTPTGTPQITITPTENNGSSESFPVAPAVVAAGTVFILGSAVLLWHIKKPRRGLN
ncbi:MAG: right-handed parallel beta-helix repeat-containing protein [Candidatus Bathyarchaeia archaeon]|jgi:parallel beta-helix repeat protein